MPIDYRKHRPHASLIRACQQGKWTKLLPRFLIDLIERRLVTHLATNGAGIIHDFELAMVGGTSENVAKWIQAGQFGLWHETSRLNDIIIEAAQRDEGLGEAVGRVIEEQDFSNRQLRLPRSVPAQLGLALLTPAGWPAMARGCTWPTGKEARSAPPRMIREEASPPCWERRNN